MSYQHPSSRWILRSCLYLGLFTLSSMFLALPAMAGEVTVNIVGDSFSPPTVTIQAGDTVRWVNDGGSNNVAEANGLFRSGDLSTDTWQYSHTFSGGGSYRVYSERDQNLIQMQVNVEGLFVDNFDFGHLGAWDEIAPVRPDCFCYFSSDCISSEFCDYGPGGFSTEDICNWVDGKPEGVPGAGCNLPHNGVWGGEICDGVCAPSSAGSVLGSEDRELLRQGISLWAEAVLTPAEEGGGPLHVGLMAQIEELDFVLPGADKILGRQVTDILILTGGQELYGYFCYHEQHPEAPDPSLWIDFSDQPCRAAIARLTIDALLSAIDGGDVKPALAQLPVQCPEWSEFIAEDCQGPDALACLGQRIEGMAEFLTTPKSGGVSISSWR